ncbi:lysozyme [Streptomyces sp. LP05-1]|uniref:Lysozyme n=1 Tax=Streptomyces pyxinae TaxID=2970734 RepID=A0ABT2CA62_9ACTN|nr:lysozyme [Streptomyces sp. LP05-1]MCS0634293.1 lysozyme [Streptomyces sp. LP05-1]
MIRPRTPRRLLAPALALLTALALTPSATATATAAAGAGHRTAADTDPPTPFRGEAYLGMGVAAHDGTGRPPPAPRAAQSEGVDVSSHQGAVDWPALRASGVEWAYVKATESASYRNPYFTQQYDGSYDQGMIRGAYHFATPDTSSGAAQADFFVDNGGGWSPDGRTLPGVLDIEWNPYGAACYGRTPAQLTAWISDFVTRYRARTGRDAVIYTATSWWRQCTGDHPGFGAAHPLWIARYDSAPGDLPSGWPAHTMWQYTSTGPTVGDHDRFNGPLDQVQSLADG